MLRLTWRDWVRHSLIGIGIGAVVLGIGGRVAMRGIAVLSGAPPGFSFGGGLRPVDSQRLFLFLPLVLIYGFLLRVLSRRRTLVTDAAVKQTSPTEAAV